MGRTAGIDRKTILDQIDVQLVHEPTVETRNRKNHAVEEASLESCIAGSTTRAPDPHSKWRPDRVSGQCRGVGRTTNRSRLAVLSFGRNSSNEPQRPKPSAAKSWKSGLTRIKAETLFSGLRPATNSNSFPRSPRGNAVLAALRRIIPSPTHRPESARAVGHRPHRPLDVFPGSVEKWNSVAPQIRTGQGVRMTRRITPGHKLPTREQNKNLGKKLNTSANSVRTA